MQGVDHIIHAGDIGSLEVLEALRLIAPVTAVRGNTDHGAWARHLRSRDLPDEHDRRHAPVRPVGDVQAR